MDLESVKKYLEGEETENNEGADSSKVTKLPNRFIERFVTQGVKVDLIEPGRIICSMKIPPHLLNAGNFLHGGATATIVDVIGSAVVYTSGLTQTGVSVEINVSYLDAAFLNEEIEIEARTLRVGKAVAVVSVELRKKKNGKIIAQGRHTKYLAPRSKL
ncbi:hypothetical protein AALP_AA1G037200 [Arabis alpina]|uniref:Thioesterase domain-containing protein n=1 Tax=Arabis alpina TaxID=50452 RepID=A0A087HKW8_ARAAL|nr:hypothetical protein AALP_AA1G037200 [Arabis alpina]